MNVAPWYHLMCEMRFLVRSVLWTCLMTCVLNEDQGRVGNDGCLVNTIVAWNRSFSWSSMFSARPWAQMSLAPLHGWKLPSSRVLMPSFGPPLVPHPTFPCLSRLMLTALPWVWLPRTHAIWKTGWQCTGFDQAPSTVCCSLYLCSCQFCILWDTTTHTPNDLCFTGQKGVLDRSGGLGWPYYSCLMEAAF